MLRSLYSGISGMKVNQTKLDVIGNNISNVGTTAFKGSRTRFQDMLNQNVNSAMAPSLNLGGVNPSTVGLGVKLAGIDTMTSQGSMQPTSRNLDMAVDGDGYFMVLKGPDTYAQDEINVEADNTFGDVTGDIYYTRDGSFTLDSDGNLLNSDGLRVLGYSVSGTSMPNSTTSATSAVAQSIVAGQVNFVDADSVALTATEDLKTLKIPDKVYDTENAKELRVVSFSVEKNGVVKAVCEGGKIAVLGQIAMASFKNPGGLEKMGSNLYSNSSNSGEAVIRTGTGAATDNEAGYGDVLQGMLEMSNVDLAEQFTEMIVTTRAFQASGKMISTGDEILQEIINLKR